MPIHTQSVFPPYHEAATGTYFLNGWRLGGGVLYKMLVTASSALRDLGSSGAGRGGGRERWNFLYSSADVESSTDLGGLFELDWELEESKRVVVLDAAVLNPCERRRAASDIVVAVMASWRPTRRQ